MHILVVSQYFWPEHFRVNDLVAGLVARGHQVTVLTGYPNYPDGQVFASFRADPAAFNTHAGANIVRVPLVARGRGGLRLLINYLSFAASATVLGMWKLRRCRFDAIFVCQLSPVTVALPAIAFRRLKRAPMALWVLDLWPDTLEAIGVLRAKAALTMVGRLVEFIYHRCDLVLAQSRSFIPQIRRYSGSTEVRYFPSWAEDVSEAGEQSLVPAAEVPVRDDLFTIVFTGNVGDAQDFPAILDAAELLKNRGAPIRWVVVGDGRAAPWVRDEIKRRALEQQVVMAGRYPVERMPSFYRHAQALLVSLKSEPIFSMTIPGKLQSYLAAGIPILAMLDGEGASVVHEAGAGAVCDAGDSGGLAAAALKLAATTPAERAAMGQRGRDLGAMEFDRTRQIDRLASWLRELSESSRRSRAEEARQ